MTKPIVWQPSKKIIKNANVTGFMKKHDIATYEELIHKSTTGVEWFWENSVRETGIDWFETYTYLADASEGFPFTKWFVGGRINITHNCVDRHAKDPKTAKKIAHIWQGECGAIQKTTYKELFEQTNQVANALKSLGVGVGDAVALYMPMLPELLPIFFGAMKIGAFVVPIFSGFGTEAVKVRLNDAKVKVVFTADGTLRKGKALSLKSMLDPSLAECPSLKKCIVVRRLHHDTVPMQKKRDVFYDEFLFNRSVKCECEELKSEQECMVIYTSGTTGKPKGTVHTHAGVLAQVAKEHYFHFDLKPNDVFFWITDIGWMMGPWEIIGATHFGATVVTMEGSPLHPKKDRVFALSEKTGVTHLGVSPTLIRLLMQGNSRFLSKYKLKKLRMIGSTGEPWDNDSYRWCYDKIGKSQLPIINISGGTELMGCLLAPLVIHPIKECSLQGPGLGMAVDVFDEHGGSAKPGEVGYLVCKKPAPSMTKSFLNDKKRYLETYFSKFDHTWNHGDWAMYDEQGDWYLRGRSDDTIKVSGKRTGPAEIESSLCDHPFVSEACAFGIPDTYSGQAVVSFVVLKDGVGATQFFLRDLKAFAGEKLGKTLVPKYLHVVPSLPKTRSGKIVRGMIKRHYLKKEILDFSSVENPELFQDLPVLL